LVTNTSTLGFLRVWQICAGGEEAFRKKPCGVIEIGPISPYFLEGITNPSDPRWGMADMLGPTVKAGVPVVIQGAGILGLNAPVTIAGLAAQTVAEWLGINVAIQAVNPGHPIFVTDYTGTADMSTGGRYTARPETTLAHVVLTEMAHYLDLAIWVVDCSWSPEVDVQFGWESMATILSLHLAGSDVIGPLGSLASEDITDFRAFLVANELFAWVDHLSKGITVDKESIPLELMIDLGAAPLGGNFLSSDHTLQHFRNILWRPTKLTNSLSRDAWLESGQVGIQGRGASQVEDILAGYKPKVPEHTQNALREFIAEVLDREGIRGDEAKVHLNNTYWDQP
jgi:trimethylamine--corrinoid protein Co-methyltransferase